MLSNGVMSTEIYAVLHAVAQIRPRFKYKVLRDFITADWRWPRVFRGKVGSLRDCFNEAREASSLKDQSFKATASETLTVYPVIRYFLGTFPEPSRQIPSARASFLCAGSVFAI